MRRRRSSPSPSSSSTTTILGFLLFHCHIYFLLLSWSSNKVHGSSDVLLRQGRRHAIGSPLLSSKRIVDSSSSYDVLTPSRHNYTKRRRWLPNIVDDNGNVEVTKSVDDFDTVGDLLGYRQLNRLDRHSSSSSSDGTSRNSNSNRSNMLRLTKTGTTIVGVTSRNGVVLAADARATMGASTGMIVADASCVKLHPLSTTTWMAGAGSAADLQHVAKLMRTHAKLYAVRYSTESSTSASSNGSSCSAGIGNPDTIRINVDYSTASSTKTQMTDIATSVDVPSVHTICRWIQSHLVQSSCNLYVIIGGWDTVNDRPVLRAIQAQGSMDVVDYTALGSGSLAALSVLESSLPHRNGKNNNNNLSMDDAVALAVRAVQAGIDNDLGSGSHVDVCIIQRPGTGTTGTTAAATTRYIQRYTSPEQLPVLLDDHGDDDATGSTTLQRDRQESRENVKHGEEMSDASTRGTPRSHGVNGFGNRPYTIQSQRVLRSGSAAGTGGNNDEAGHRWSDLVR